MRKSIFDIMIQSKTNFGRKLSTMVAAVMLASVAAMSLVCCSEKHINIESASPNAPTTAGAKSRTVSSAS